MNIKDIVNRDIVNLTNCESEPIHIPGTIQPHGFLIGIKKQDYLIDYCSANSTDFIGLKPEQLLGQHFTDIFQDVQIAQLSAHITDSYIDSPKPFVTTRNGIPFNTTAHLSGETFLLELEPFPNGALDLPNLYDQTRRFVSAMEKNNTLVELCQEIAHETREITGYDRVMIYRFDKQYNGEVIAESKRADLESFAGQKYPHTDIPAQARELYIRNPLRMIADINYTPVPLLTTDSNEEKSNQSLDLSLSILRSVSPIHIEYLQNMGVGATLTVSLLQDNKLWGLIACHHYSPKILPHYQRLAALLQGNFLTSQIKVREVAEEFKISEQVDKALFDSLSLLHEDENFVENHYNSASLLQLANASGVVIYQEGKLYTNGLVPAQETLLPFLGQLRYLYKNGSGHTEQLLSIYPEGRELTKFAAGIIYHAMSASSSDCILWMRQERIETVHWAGNPEKAIDMNAGGFRLSPRKSFELWKEVVKDKSAEWRKSELNAASSFAYALQKYLNLRQVRLEEERYRIINEELKAANKELANINWISTHDLKEPLRKIQIFASKVLDREDPELSLKVKDSVERMRYAAEKMQLLIEDILNYSKTGSVPKVFESTDLNEVFQSVISDLKDTIEEKKAEILHDILPEIPAIRFQIQQLFVNLISNSLKFAQDGVSPVISITYEIVGPKMLPGNSSLKNVDYHKISFTDNGIGFDQEYRERIFQVFQRLHPHHKYPGTGIGLAICKKIVENHNGILIANAKENEGAVFTIFLPVQLTAAK
ncbi:Phytochrome-like protein cph1 [Dyadobacter sp. CECT 9275]|uniref:histidine kinase n=1 Tax=Dyadobacter helix TaxID=2822344 RepID=A0A916NAU0_9BACT|nr:ATP-binding protein [Dyadobacter sp. CECT 9275]CAG4990003.1 Phytochrome-like protein cph1 [Dyadobacter sp. CECT 9275]